MKTPYPTLTTQRLILRPFTLSDVPDLCLLAGDHRISEMCLNIPYPYFEETGRAWISEHQEAYMQDKAVIFAVCMRDTGRLAGACGLELEFSDKRGELGYWIGYQFQGNGYATEAVSITLQYGFTGLSLDRITATSILWNAASARVLEKSGFSKEGVLRGHVLKNGLFTDIVVWGLLREEFMNTRDLQT